MAKPIRKTPSLKEDQANKFVKNMIKTESRNINKVEQELVNIISYKS